MRPMIAHDFRVAHQLHSPSNPVTSPSSEDCTHSLSVADCQPPCDPDTQEQVSSFCSFQSQLVNRPMAMILDDYFGNIA